MIVPSFDKLPRRRDNRIQAPNEKTFDIINGNDDGDLHSLVGFFNRPVVDLPRFGREVDANQRDAAV